MLIIRRWRRRQTVHDRLTMDDDDGDEDDRGDGDDDNNIIIVIIIIIHNIVCTDRNWFTRDGSTGPNRAAWPPKSRSLTTC